MGDHAMTPQLLAFVEAAGTQVAGRLLSSDSTIFIAFLDDHFMFVICS